jgi:uncharacterized membrane protein YhfC
MIQAAYWAGLLAVFGIPVGALIWARRKYEIEVTWYGVAFLGGVAAVVTFVVFQILLQIYVAVLGIPANIDRATLFSSPHFLVFLPLAMGLTSEALKGGCIRVFHTQFSRSRWIGLGAAVGVGAGLLEAFMLLGPKTLMILNGEEPLDSVSLWLEARCLLNVGFHATLTPVLLYWAAQKKKVRGWLTASALHALALFLYQYLANVVGFVAPWLNPLILIATTAVALAILFSMGRWRGWPM